MDAITYGSLFLILGSTRLSVLTCCISENPGKHGFLSADAETQEELKDYLLYEEDGHIGLFVMLGETIKPLFYGTVTCMEVKAQGGRCVLHLEALTESYQMHRILPAIRSFQNSLWESLIRSGYREILLWFMHADIPLKIRRCRELINYKVQRGLQGL